MGSADLYKNFARSGGIGCGGDGSNSRVPGPTDQSRMTPPQTKTEGAHPKIRQTAQPSQASKQAGKQGSRQDTSAYGWFVET